MPANRFDQLIDEWAPKLQRAFLDAVAKVRDRVQIEVVAELLREGQVEEALRAVGLDPLAFRGFENGLEEAYDSGGSYTADRIPAAREPSGLRLHIGFDARNPRAEQWLRTHSSGLVTQIVEDQRQMVRGFLAAGMKAGQNPRTVALDLAGRMNRTTGHREGGVIGLTTSQEEWVRRYAAELADPQTMRQALGRALRDKRFDRSVLAAIREERPIPAEMRDRMVRAYRNRAVRYRAETIGRTEAMAALHQSAQEAFQQAIDANQVKESTVRKVWHSAADRRVRHTHRVLNGQSVPFRGVFISPSGATLRYPGDPEAPGSETVMCRCWMDTKVDHLSALRSGGGGLPPSPPPGGGGSSGPPRRLPAWSFLPDRRSSGFALETTIEAKRFGVFATDEQARELAATLLAGAPEAIEIKARWDARDRWLRLVATGTGLHIERNFVRNGGQIVVDHTFFEVSEEHRGGGHARRMMRASLHAYDDLGIDRVEVHAALSVGGYAWARNGFAADPDSARSMRDDLARVADQLGGERSRRLREVLSLSGDLRLMYDVAQLSDERGAYGKRLLLGSNWHGFINLRDPEHRALVNEALAP